MKELQSFEESEKPACEKYIKKILEKINQSNWFSPLLIMEIASKNINLSFGVVKEYLVNRVKKIQNSIDKNRKQVEEHNQKIQEMEERVHDMKTKAQLFQLKNCAECGRKLGLPLIHFMCGHSFHDECLYSEIQTHYKECSKCSMGISYTYIYIYI